MQHPLERQYPGWFDSFYQYYGPQQYQPTEPGGQGGGLPSGPPPDFVPPRPQTQGGIGTFAVDPGAIRRCLFRFTYVWLTYGRQFWFFPTFVGRNSIAGFRWNGYRWVYFGVDLRYIASFQCSF